MIRLEETGKLDFKRCRKALDEYSPLLDTDPATLSAVVEG